MSAQDQARARPVPGALLQTFAFLGGPIAYAAHLLAGATLVTLSCEARTTLPIHLVTLAALGLVTASALAGRHVLSRAQPDSSAWFLAAGGLLLDALAAGLIVFAELPAHLLDPCLP